MGSHLRASTKSDVRRETWLGRLPGAGAAPHRRRRLRDGLRHGALAGGLLGRGDAGGGLRRGRRGSRWRDGLGESHDAAELGSPRLQGVVNLDGHIRRN
eukprot:9503789-Pyramimonas_sp.AAC.5